MLSVVVRQDWPHFSLQWVILSILMEQILKSLVKNGILNNSSGMTRNSLKKYLLPWRNNFVILRIYMRRIIHVYNCIIMEMKKTIEKIPTWAFGYIFNGDMTGLTDEEVKQIDEALEQIGVDIVCTPADEEAQPYFTHYPLFGLPTEVEDCVILYR